MRIKEEIKRVGEFWLPSSPKRQITGTLTISDGGDIKLELPQPLVNGIRGFNLGDFGQILGRVEKIGPVTFDNCSRIAYERSIIDGVLMGPEVIRAHRVFTGIRCSEGLIPRFNTVSFSVEGIDEWVGIGGIEVDRHSEKRAVTISYDKPADISLNLQNGMQLLITFTSTFPGFPNLKDAKVSQKTYFRLISQKARELDEFTSVAQKIMAFLCFVMNEIVCLDSMSATSDNLRQNIGDGRTAPIPVKIYCPSWPYAKDQPEINELDMLFRFTEIQGRAESIINRWIDNYEQITPALDLYFLTKTGTLPTLNIHFLILVQAVEAYHRKTSGERCMALGDRIQKMTEPFDKFMCGEKRVGLIKIIKDTRNYLTHYDSSLEPKAAKGEDLKFLCLKMNALFRLQFLKLIGFDEQEIDDIVDKCPYFKGECNL